MTKKFKHDDGKHDWELECGAKWHRERYGDDIDGNRGVMVKVVDELTDTVWSKDGKEVNEKDVPEKIFYRLVVEANAYDWEE